jgi:hypothetical protein
VADDDVLLREGIARIGNRRVLAMLMFLDAADGRHD